MVSRRLARRAQLVALLPLLATAACASMITGGNLIRDPNAPTGVIVVQNGSSAPVNVVLISHCSASTYGLNRLPKNTEIDPGYSYRFTVTAGCWDVAAGSTHTSSEARHRMQVEAGGGVRYTVTD
jgi:hypothetical protein